MNTVRPKDLRIGNLINGIYIYEDDDKNGEIIEVEKTTFCTVVSIDTTDSTYRPIMVESDANIESFERMEGIPLNEEWLLKAGFEHVLNEHTNADFWQIKRKKNDYRPHITIYKNRITVGNNTGVKYFNDVHSLQNLYFALSGEELTIK